MRNVLRIRCPDSRTVGELYGTEAARAPGSRSATLIAAPRQMRNATFRLLSVIVSFLSIGSVARAQCLGYSLDSPPRVTLSDAGLIALRSVEHRGELVLVPDSAVLEQLPTIEGAADLNRDGYPDLIGVNGDGRIFVAINQRDGTFVRSTLLLRGYVFTIADFNRDGRLDLVYGAIPFFAAGDGFGGFDPTAMISSGGISAMVSGDFNGDGIPDFAAVYERPFQLPPQPLTIFQGLGDGRFVAQRTDVLDVRGPLVAADLDRDGRDEIIGWTYGPGAPIAIHWSDGRSTTMTTRPPTETGDGTPVAVADLNGDGAPEVVVAASYRRGDDFLHENVVLTNDGKGNLSIGWQSPIGTARGVADVDGDGKVDLITDDFVLHGNGNGTFRDLARTPAVRSSRAFAADLDGDGEDDVAIAKAALNNVTDQELAVEWRLRDGSFKLQTSNDPRVTSVVGTGDVNGDGRAELLTVADGTLNAVDLKQDGSLDFIASVPGTASFAATGRFRGDGSTELAALNRGGIAIFDPRATMPMRTEWRLADSDAYELAIADMNRDALDDIVVLGRGETETAYYCYSFTCPLKSPGFISVYLSTGFGFTAERRIFEEAGSYLYRLGVGDLDGNGTMDIATSTLTRPLVVLWGTGDATFSAQAFDVPGSVIRAADLNGDGISDLVLAAGNALYTVLGSRSGFVTGGPYLTGSPDPVVVSRSHRGGAATILQPQYVRDEMVVFRPRCANRARAVRH